MAFDRFLIAPLKSGLHTDMRPWLIPDDAWENLTNAYIFRGRLRKRFGTQWMGILGNDQKATRLRVNVGTTTDGSGNLALTTLSGNVLNVGSMFSAGSTLFTVTVVPTVVGVGGEVNTLSTGTTAVGTLQLSSSGPNVYKFGISGSQASIASTPVYWYPALPVMGLCNYEFGAINNQPSLAFDTQFVYIFSGGSWIRSVDSVNTNTPIWHGGNTNFFWTSNWKSPIENLPALFVSNFYVLNYNGAVDATDDPIWTYNVNDSTTTWIPYSNDTNTIGVPYTIFDTAGDYISTALIVVPFRNRMVFLNTVEVNANASTNAQYVNRCRFSINGSPFAVTTSGADNAPYAWLEPNQSYTNGAATSYAAGAGFIDAPTEEAIVSAEFIKDRLIVFFQQSTWELAWTGNDVQPFIWLKINTELGSESTFSAVPFDKQILTVGNVGVHSCNGINVQRIDDDIPDQIFEIDSDNSGVQRVHGIRDYYVEMVYWAYPADNTNNTVFPNRILVYNYKNATWAIFNDSFTCFGYFEQQTDVTWADCNFPWQEANFTWDSQVIQPQARQIIAGNQEGWVLIINPDLSRNAPSLQITNITSAGGILTLTIIDHNFQNNDYIIIENAQGITGVNGNIYLVTITDANTITIDGYGTSGTYTGGGTAALVSNYNILSKQWNPYVSKDRNVYLARIDFCVLKTPNGQVTVDYYPSSTELSMIYAGQATGSIMGTGVLETSAYAVVALESLQERLWHPVYFQSDGEFIQINIYLSPEQITNPAIAFSDLQIEALLLITQSTTYRLQ